MAGTGGGCVRSRVWRGERDPGHSRSEEPITGPRAAPSNQAAKRPRFQERPVVHSALTLTALY